MVLLLKAVRDQSRALFFWTLGLVSMVAMTLSVYPTVRSSSAGLAEFLNHYPKALREIFRMEDYTSGPGYLSTELFSLMLPLAFISIGASWGSNATAQEEERRTADILLTLPISRVRILGTKIVAAIMAQIGFAVVVVLMLIVGIRFVNLSIGTNRIIAGAISGVLLGILFNSIATLMGVLWGKKPVALGGAIGLALPGFLLYSLAPLVKTLDRLTSFNPFQWTLGSRPLFNGLNVGYSVLSLLLAMTLYVSSLFLFKRRDIQA